MHEVIEAFRQAPSNAERGIKFEKLMVRYFELDPMLAATYDRVWRWIDWPDRKGKADTGIDLVARARDTGELTAVQCKFYEPTHTLAKADIDSFFTASGKAPFTNRIIISTTDKWGKNAEDALAGQQIPVERIGLAEIADAPIDWDLAWPADELQVTISPATQHDLRPHQQTAVDAVLAGFAEHDRGKLIMACGTGKTFTALKLCEQIAVDNDGRARVLFLVPSISLLSQTLREWTAQSRLDLRAYAVCSDTKVSRAAEDINPHDVPLPATTDPTKLLAQMAPGAGRDGLTVVFSTYQSLPVVHDAQLQGLADFDLVVCDEAHRTTGVTLVGEDDSNFVRVHDADYLAAARRLYMTATPRLFDQDTKSKAEEHSAELASMDDETKFGPEFHRLSFGTAVEHGLLTDYKVLVLTVDEEVIARPLQEQVVNSNVEINLDDATKIVGCWNGLAKRAGEDMDGNGFPPDAVPMKRAVAFMRDIKSSKQLAGAFGQVIDAYEAAHDDDALECSVRHVDGTFNALERNAQLTWLKAPIPDGECRILSNARCLSEGVDVPALDAVMFMHPRNSVVDVVQSVGRVMRRSPGKDYGYIILPVAVPSGTPPEKALADNKRFKVVWQVLNALRAHDDRFNAMVNSIELNKGQHMPGEKGNDQLLGGHIGATADSHETIGDGTGTTDADTVVDVITQPALFSLTDWRDAIYARIVKNVGTRAYWEDWASDVADIAAAQQTRIKAILANNHDHVGEAFAAFVTALRGNLNDSITDADAISMLSQHMITRPVFDALFAGYDFAAHNPVSKTMQTMVDQLEGQGLAAETASLESFYASVRLRAEGVTSAAGKQQIITELYERFFKIAFKKQSESLGIVYIPVPIVDFILRAANEALQVEFGKSITDEGVHVLDPFTGTGTFIVRLLQSGIIQPDDLARKYASELHANEIMLLAYYIAAVNIEATYHGLTGAEYTPFDGIVLTDTFQITEAGDAADTSMFPTNNDRIEAQLNTPITVITGNPPYSVGQGSANDNNANLKYPTLDGRIEHTYVSRSAGTNKNSLYNSYIRALRWGTDRLAGSGVLAFVTNGGWLDSNSADGIRLAFGEEFTSLWVYNLRGSQLGANWRAEGGKVFGEGAKTAIAIIIAVKDDSRSGPCRIRYRQVADYLTTEDKLSGLGEASLADEWTTISPNAYGDWLGARSESFGTLTPIGHKGSPDGAVFRTYSSGLKTGRDSWCYNFSQTALADAVESMLEHYNSTVRRALREGGDPGAAVDFHTTAFSWNRSALQQLARGKLVHFDQSRIFEATYRPFVREWCYFDRAVNDMVYRMPTMFPTRRHRNPGLMIMSGSPRTPFSVLAVDHLPDSKYFVDGGHFFPRWTFEDVEGETTPSLLTAEHDADVVVGYRRMDNMGGGFLTEVMDVVGANASRQDVFDYVYAVLHSPAYRAAYEIDLKKMLPRIPPPRSKAQFFELRDAGHRLAELHVGYEKVEPYPLEDQTSGLPLSDGEDRGRVTKMRWRSRTDHSAIVYNNHLTLAGIPDEAHEYRLGSRTALEWLIDRYQVTTDKKSGIVSDPNAWATEHGDSLYIVELIKRITTVSVKTVEIVNGLPELDLG